MPPEGEEKKLFQKQGRIKPQHEKRKPQIFPVLDDPALFSPVCLPFQPWYFQPFMIVSSTLRIRHSKISALHANWDWIQRFSLPETGKKLGVFSKKGGGRSKGFWPKHLPLNVMWKLIDYLETWVPFWPLSEKPIVREGPHCREKWAGVTLVDLSWAFWMIHDG